MTADISASNCCNSIREPLTNLGQAIEQKFNQGVDKVSGKTFEFVAKLKTTHADSTFAKVGKIFAAFLGTATILPLVGLFAAAGAVKLWNAIGNTIHRQAVSAPAVQVTIAKV